jgi:hypothetical protein
MCHSLGEAWLQRKLSGFRLWLVSRTFLAARSQARQQGPVEAILAGRREDHPGTTPLPGWLPYRRSMRAGSRHCRKQPVTPPPAKPFTPWSTWTLKKSSPYSRRAASDAIESGDVTISHHTQTAPSDTLPAPPFCAGPWSGTEQERSGQITSYINRTD